jgi:hypothetical protein
MAGGGISGGQGRSTPCHCAARLGPRHQVVWWHGGSLWVVPCSSLPHFRCKNLIKVFWNFLRNFIFGGFQKLIDDYKHRKNDYGTMKNKFKPNL